MKKISLPPPSKIRKSWLLDAYFHFRVSKNIKRPKNDKQKIMDMGEYYGHFPIFQVSF